MAEANLELSFTQILINISRIETLELTDEDKIELIGELKAFYEVNDRHRYSDIAEYIYNNPDDIEYLVSNLQELDIFCKDVNLKDRIFKIIDHIRLERIRLTYLRMQNESQTMKSIFRTKSIASKQFKDEAMKIQKKIEPLGGKVTIIENKLKNFNVESITILGIFSGIVMAFFGGLGFFNEILKNMHKTNRHKLTFIVLLIGFILFNIFFFFMYYIGRLVDKPIRNECIDESCNKCNKKCSLCAKLKKLYPILYYANCFFIITLLIVFAFWFFIKYILWRFLFLN